MTSKAILPTVVMFVMIALVAALVALNLGDIGKKKTWDAEFPMVNTEITWLQTYYSGAWDEV